MEYDDFSGINGMVFSSTILSITRPAKTKDIWWCPVGNNRVVNFTKVKRFDIKNRLLYFDASKEAIAKGVISKIEVEIDNMSMALFTWEQTNVSESNTS